MCVPGRGTHVSSDTCLPGRDMQFLAGRGTHIIRDMCFPSRRTHVSSDMGKGKTYH